MTQNTNKYRELEERTFRFAERTKESCLWLRLVECGGVSQEQEREALTAEAVALRKIFSSILEKSS